MSRTTWTQYCIIEFENEFIHHAVSRAWSYSISWLRREEYYAIRVLSKASVVIDIECFERILQVVSAIEISQSSVIAQSIARAGHIQPS